MEQRRRWWMWGLLLLVLLALVPQDGQTQASFSGGGQTKTVLNDPTTGTVLGGPAKVGATGAIRTTPTDAGVPAWIVVGSAGTNPLTPAVLAVSGDISCVMDQTLSNTRGMLVVVSPTNNAQCHPLPVSTPPSTGYVLGTMADNSTIAGQTALVSAQLISYVAGSGTGLGSVTSVGFTPPNLFTATGTPSLPITGAGAIVQSWANQAANCVVATPTTGLPAQPICRPLALADMPNGVMSTCAGDLSGTAPNCVVAQASGLWAFKNPGTATLSGPGHNYTGCDNRMICRLSSGTDQIITGLDKGTDGRVIQICNVGTTKLSLMPIDGGSTGTNQFDLGAPLRILPKQCAPVWYDSASGKWRAWSTGQLDYQLVKTCDIPFGSASTSAAQILADDDVPNACVNDTGIDLRIVGVSVYTNLGGPTFRPKLQGQGDTSILTSDCTGSPNVLIPCTSLNTVAPPVLKPLGSDHATCPAGQACGVFGGIVNQDTSTYAYIHLVLMP